MIIPAGTAEQLLHICLQRGINRNECTTDRMSELNAECMQCLPCYLGPAAAIQIIAA